MDSPIAWPPSHEIAGSSTATSPTHEIADSPRATSPSHAIADPPSASSSNHAIADRPTTSSWNPTIAAFQKADNTFFSMESPNILQIVSLFPSYLAEAIKTYASDWDTCAGAVTMSFPDISSLKKKFGSIMSLEIEPNKVERLALELFNTHIESDTVQRYILLPTGVRITPTSDLVLRGCDRCVIRAIFGAEIHTAITSSPVYKEELKKGRNLTETVTMTISHNLDHGAVINLTLGEKEGLWLKTSLFPE